MPILAIVGIVLVVIVASTLVSGLAGGAGGSGSAPLPFGSTDNVSAPTGSLGANMITHDPATWPTGDVIWNICCAIASAEGANIEGSVPDRLNNPGDISDGAQTYGFEPHSGSNVTRFPDKAVGWQWLYNKVQNIQQGGSTVYSPSMTWTQIAQKWAGNWQSWVANVSGFLGVSPDSRFSDYTG